MLCSLNWCPPNCPELLKFLDRGVRYGGASWRSAGEWAGIAIAVICWNPAAIEGVDMVADHITAIGAEYRKETQRIEPKLLFFGTTLLMSHILTITPSEFDAGGIKIAVDDVAVVHGGLALVFLYYFWSLIVASFQGSALMPVQIDRRTARHLLSLAQKPYKDEKTKRMQKRTPKQAKRMAWWLMFGYNIIITPFALVVIAIVIAAALIGIADVLNFGDYLIDKLIDMEV